MALVTLPGQRRVALRGLHEHLADKLHRSKWPQLIVYMDALPKTANQKLIRLRFAERAGLPTLQLAAPPKDCLFEAVSPAPVRSRPVASPFVSAR